MKAACGSRTDSMEYRILRRWIERGTPRDSASTPTLVRLGGDAARAGADRAGRSRADRGDGRLLRRQPARCVASGGLRAIDRPDEDLAGGPGAAQARSAKRPSSSATSNARSRARWPSFPPGRSFTGSRSPANNYIDEQVFAKLRTLRINPSAICTDNRIRPPGVISICSASFRRRPRPRRSSPTRRRTNGRA